MIVYFLRHASAGQKKANAAADEKRALDEEGIAQSRFVGRALAALDVQVDAMISSPLKRATQTASLVANEIGHDQKLKLSEALRPEASFSQFRDLLDEHNKADAIMVAGHNPSLSGFLSQLLNPENPEVVDLKKGAVARVELSARNRSAVLQWCVTPKIVRAIYDSAGASSRPKTSRK